MPEPTDRRTRKRLATRQAISNVATRLFWERGFDAVTVDEIAEAADVGRMTVFNHFPRKEDMFFDREAEGREVLRTALLSRDKDVAPIEALRALAHRLVADQAPYVVFSAESRSFVATIAASETLKARARAIRDELAEVVASALAETVGRAPDDRDARLASAMLLAIWATAFTEAHRVYGRTQDPQAARSCLLAIVDQGTLGLVAAMAATPYA